MKMTAKMTLCAMVFLILGFLACAGETDEKKLDRCTDTEKNAANKIEFYLSVPAYLYGPNSLCGLQGGFRYGHGQVRFDLNFAEDYWNGNDSWAFMPSIGFFYSKDFQSMFRIYEGLTFGIEKGMVHSFDGTIGFINYIAGTELLSFGKTTFFIEVGTGVSFSQEEGAYNGGTIVGGGIRYYF